MDIERNLRAPLTGIRHAAHRLGLAEPDIAVAVRTGDTAAEERRKLASKPPDSEHPYGHGRYETLAGLGVGAGSGVGPVSVGDGTVVS